MRKIKQHFQNWCKNRNLSVNNIKAGSDDISFTSDSKTFNAIKNSIDKTKYSIEKTKNDDGLLNVTLSKNKDMKESRIFIRKLLKENGVWFPEKQNIITSIDDKKGEYKQCERNALIAYQILKGKNLFPRIIRGLLKLTFLYLPGNPENNKMHTIDVNPHYWIEIYIAHKRYVYDITPFMMPHLDCPADNADNYIYSREYIPDIQLTQVQIDDLINRYKNSR